MSDGKIQRELRSGRVRLTVWENKDEQGKRYNSIDVCRLYKNGAGKWQRTYSFKTGDLLDLAAVCQRAHQLLNLEERWQGLSKREGLVDVVRFKKNVR